jgi:hypothetical protein
MSKNPKPETPANINIPKPERKPVITFVFIMPHKSKILKQNCVGGKPILANIR